jgi:dihydroneopterin aldolase
MIKVGLHGAEFFARHGYYAEEQILGNYFVVDIEVSFQPHGPLSDDNLQHTLNYEQLYAIAAHEMKQTRQLLETVAQSIADTIKRDFDYITSAVVTVKKRNPPLKGIVAASSVTVSL